MGVTNLKGVSNYGETTIGSVIRDGISTYYEWGFLNIGAFTNVNIPSSGAYGGNEARLAAVRHPQYTNGQVWQGFRQNWVWESGISYGVQPINISGVYVNGAFKPSTGIGAFAHTIDYPNGQVIFSTALTGSPVVTCEYSYKRIKFTNVDDIEFKDIQERSFRVDDSNFLNGSGNKPFDRNNLQLPIVAVECVPKRYFPRGVELGGGHYMSQVVLFHIYADIEEERTKIFDIITSQHNSTIVLYDMNLLATNNAFPLNINGNIANQSTRNYNNLVGNGSQYGFRQCIFKSFEGQEQNVLCPNLFGAIARLTAEIPLPNV